ncbi:hypothetical protein ColTof4_01425 [Colletotrichum tofieldiae]|nr:hypothetical protein ColTof3_08682 [Colletotrichum tofieldiae]GKT69002.1 hypothetical protein ColTof4_01425 [Colletotrichum tofieldiae]
MWAFGQNESLNTSGLTSQYCRPINMGTNVAANTAREQTPWLQRVNWKYGASTGFHNRQAKAPPLPKYR